MPKTWSISLNHLIAKDAHNEVTTSGLILVASASACSAALRCPRSACVIATRKLAATQKGSILALAGSALNQNDRRALGTQLSHLSGDGFNHELICLTRLEHESRR